MKTTATFLSTAFSTTIIKNSLKVSLVVGSLLLLINHGDKMFQAQLNSDFFIQATLNYLIPYCVSTYSAVKTVQMNSYNHTEQKN